MEVYEVIFSSPEIKTIGDYVNEPGSPASKFVNREQEFLDRWLKELVKILIKELKIC